jgi:hypothetical protein
MARTAASITIQQIPVITLFFFGIQNAIAARGQHAVAATGCVANIGILFACIAEFHTRIQHTVTALRHNNRKETFGCAIHTLFSVSGFSRITLFAKTCLHLSITAEAAFQLALCAAAIAAFHIAVITFFFFETSEALVWADIKSEGGEIFKIVNIHLPVTQHGATTPKQLEDLKSAFQKLDTLGDFVLCGDMNAPRIYETFKKISEKYRDNIPLEYKTSLDRNLHRIGKDKFVTEGMDKYVVDGLFTTPLYETSNVRLMDSLSDHMAVVGEISKK